MVNDRLKIIFEESFYALSVSWALLAVLELVFPRLVLAYINLNYLLLAALAVAIILLCIEKPGAKS